MAFEYYMDVHVPSSITHGLQRRGIDVLTSQDDGATRLGDEELLQRATELNRILYTQDQDLLTITHNWQNSGKTFFGLVFGHQESTKIGRCIEDLEIIATCCNYDEINNCVIYVPLS